MGYWKLWWHCLWQVLNLKHSHRMCKIGEKNFCECGYMNQGISFNDELDNLIKKGLKSVSK